MTTVPPSEVFSSSELLQVNQAENKTGPSGSIFKGRHGYTHYVLDGCESSQSLVVLSHGIGTSQQMYQDVANRLNKDGFSTLRYDFFGHGYSKFDDRDQGGDGNIWFDYTPELFVDQLEDLLDHVIADDGEYSKQSLTAIVGHSTGALVAIHAVDRWTAEGHKKRSLPKIVLLSPALWANKPVVARIADKIPRLMTFLFKSFNLAKAVVGKSYIENMDVAFSRDESTGKFIHESTKKGCESANKRLFGLIDGVKEHPFLAASVVGINGYTIRGDLLAGHRKTFLDVLNKVREHKTKILFVWGKLDRSVPFKDHIETVNEWERDHDNLELVVPEIGHECVSENSDIVTNCILRFLGAS